MSYSRTLVLVALLVSACEQHRVTSVALPQASAPSESAIAVSATIAPITPLSPNAFFPPHTFPEAVDGFVSEWYGKQLTAMREPSMWATATRGETAYRFVWLRTWGHPVAVRVVASGAGAHLVATRLTGSGGYDPGAIDVKRERELSMTEWDRIETALTDAQYDTMATEGPMGNDGAQWIIERAKSGHYRLVERWTPKHDPKSAAFERACEVFLDLAGRDLVTGDVY